MSPATEPLLSADDIGALLALAAKAAQEILRVYNADDFGIEHKNDDSPVTAADLASHRIITAGLPGIGGPWPILSEESAASHEAELRQSWPTYWCVDPLDGTKDFIRRTGEFAINIALVHEGEAHWGLVFAPALNKGWHGGKAYGAYVHDAVRGSDEPIRPQIPAHRPLRALISRNHAGNAESHIVDVINASTWGPVELKAHGSSLKYCAIASGEVDFMPRLHPCMEWDTAAPQAILEAVGGQVLDLHGEPLRYNARATLVNPSLVALADPALPWRDWMEPNGKESVS